MTLSDAAEVKMFPVILDPEHHVQTLRRRGRRRGQPCPSRIWFGDSHNDPRSGGTTTHKAQDIFAPQGALVVAPTSLRVTDAGTSERGGGYAFLAFNGGRYYMSHMVEVFVTDGQRLEVGDPIGRVGRTGNARNTCPHLHIGVRYNGGFRPNIYEDLRAAPRLTLEEWEALRASTPRGTEEVPRTENPTAAALCGCCGQPLPTGSQG